MNLMSDEMKNSFVSEDAQGISCVTADDWETMDLLTYKHVHSL